MASRGVNKVIILGRVDLITVVEKYGAAERVHLGKQAGNVGRAVTKLPLMGKRKS